MLSNLIRDDQMDLEMQDRSGPQVPALVIRFYIYFDFLAEDAESEFLEPALSREMPGVHNLPPRLLQKELLGRVTVTLFSSGLVPVVWRLSN